MAYYRLFDKQCHRYMATGYNAKSKKDLCNQYISYKSIDTDLSHLKETNDIIDYILNDDFIIEKSTKRKFKENEE